MAAHTPVWMKIPLQQCPCTYRAKELQCYARNEGKERHRKVAICLADPTRQVVLSLIHMVTFLLTRGWVGLSHLLLNKGKQNVAETFGMSLDQDVQILPATSFLTVLSHFCFEEML